MTATATDKDSGVSLFATRTISVGIGMPDIKVGLLGTDVADGASFDFGAVAIGESVVKTFTITNPGSIDLSGLSIATDGPHAGEFSVTQPLLSTVPAGQGTTFTVTFSPQAGVVTRSAALHIASNVTGGKNPYDITLSGASSTTETTPPNLTFLPSGAVRLAFTGIPGGSYQIQRSINLIDWQPLTTVTTGPTGAVSFTDESPPAGTAFYRFRKP